MGNKVAYRLPSISLLSLEFPLPTSSSLQHPCYVPSQSRIGVIPSIPSNSNVLASPSSAQGYAYGDLMNYQSATPSYDVSYTSPTGQRSPSGALGPRVSIAPLHQMNEAPIEYTTNASIPSIGSFTSAPALSNQSSAVSSPPTYQYVAAPLWPRQSSEYIMSYNGLQGLSPSTSIVLSAGSTAPETYAVISKDISSVPETRDSSRAESPETNSVGKHIEEEASNSTLSSKASGRVQKNGESLKRKKRQCPECHLFFSNLATHKSTHLNPTARPHVCKICGRGFSRPNDLFRHFKCHWKKIGADGGQFKCPFKSGPHGDQCCHLLGIFSRCDTYKNHLKAIHFQYPGGTRKSERSFVPGCCRLCKKEFRNVDEWFTTHVDNSECSFIGSSK